MKNLIMTLTLLLGLIVNSNAQGITNTLGGDSSTDLFQVKNFSDLDLLTVTGEGNIGIGITNPVNKLDIDGTARMTGFKLTTDATSGYVLTSNSNGKGTWQALPSGSGGDDGDWTISGNNLYTTPSGNVGIGTSNPLSKLSVGGDGNSGSVVYGRTTDYLGIGGHFSAGGSEGIGVKGESSNEYGYGVYGIATGPSGVGVVAEGTSTGISATGDNYAAIFNGNIYAVGDVGINTSTPQADLDVNGSIKVGSSGTPFFEIKELTGVTSYTEDVTHISYPSGFNRDNTRILDVQIWKIGQWWGLGFADDPDQLPIRYITNAAEIQLSYDANFRNLSFRMVLMKMP